MDNEVHLHNGIWLSQESDDTYADIWNNVEVTGSHYDMW
jgi:hypothetical protein